jgi:hypothetical protein
MSKFWMSQVLMSTDSTYIPTYLSTHLGMFFSYHSFMLFKIKLLSSFVPFPLFYVNNVLNIVIQGVPELADQIYSAFSLVITESNSV